LTTRLFPERLTSIFFVILKTCEKIMEINDEPSEYFLKKLACTSHF